MNVELQYVPNCPHVDEARQLLRACMEELGLTMPIEEREGPYPSPSILVDGVDVMGEPSSKEPACRLDLPTKNRIVDALRERA